MTVAPSDSPDWSGIPGAMRFLGTIVLTGTGFVLGALTFTPTNYDGALYLVKSTIDTGDAYPSTVAVQEDSIPLLTLNGAAFAANDPPVVAFVSRVLGASWRVLADASFPAVGGPFTTTWYVFAVPSFPVSVLEQPTNPFRVDIAAATGAGGVPILRRVYDSMLVSAPAAATQATVTFPATADHRWIVDHVIWTYDSLAAAASRVGPRILDGAAPIYSSQLSIPGTAFAIDREVLGPGAGYVGTVGQAVTVDFSAAGPANTVERITAAAYLVA